jgi:hypothetical protein
MVVAATGGLEIVVDDADVRRVKVAQMRGTLMFGTKKRACLECLSDNSGLLRGDLMLCDFPEGIPRHTYTWIPRHEWVPLAEAFCAKDCPSSGAKNSTYNGAMRTHSPFYASSHDLL